MSFTYDTLTDTLNNTISTQVAPESSWTNMAGGLTKVSASSIGFVWGFTENQVFACQLPCTGNWKPVPCKATSIVDLTTDDSNVYVLSDSVMYIKPANNTADWNSISVPPNVSSLFDTQSYLWVQDTANKKYRLAKPGTTANWVQVPDSSTIRITSSSGSSLYGVDALGNAMKTDESMQSNWAAIPAFAGKKMEVVVGDIDRSAMYGVDTTHQLLRCTGNCKPVSTGGYVPSAITIEPTSRDIWMTTQTSGDLGNVFTKPDMFSAPSLLKSAGDLDVQREQIINQAKNAHVQGTRETAVSKQIKNVKDFLSSKFQINEKSKHANLDKQSVLHDRILDTTAEIAQLNTTLPLLEKILYILAAVALVYLVLGMFGWIAHLVAFLVLVGGLIYILLLQK
jgi:hypothetical protein